MNSRKSIYYGKFSVHQPIVPQCVVLLGCMCISDLPIPSQPKGPQINSQKEKHKKVHKPMMPQCVVLLGCMCISDLSLPSQPRGPQINSWKEEHTQFFCPLTHGATVQCAVLLGGMRISDLRISSQPRGPQINSRKSISLVCLCVNQSVGLWAGQIYIDLIQACTQVIPHTVAPWVCGQQNICAFLSVN